MTIVCVYVPYEVNEGAAKSSTDRIRPHAHNITTSGTYTHNDHERHKLTAVSNKTTPVYPPQICMNDRQIPDGSSRPVEWRRPKTPGPTQWDEDFVSLMDSLVPPRMILDWDCQMLSRPPDIKG